MLTLTSPRPTTLLELDATFGDRQATLDFCARWGLVVVFNPNDPLTSFVEAPIS